MVIIWHANCRDPRNGRFNSHLDETRPSGSSCGHCVMPYISHYIPISQLSQSNWMLIEDPTWTWQLKCHCWPWNWQTTMKVWQFTLTVAKLAFWWTLHTSWPQLGTEKRPRWVWRHVVTIPPCGIVQCGPSWVSVGLQFGMFMDSCSALPQRFTFPLIMTVIMGKWGDKQSGVLQEPRSPGWCKGHADQVRCLFTLSGATTATKGVHISQCVDTGSKPSIQPAKAMAIKVGWMGFPTLNYTPGSTIFHFCDLGAAIYQNVWMDILCFLLKLEIIFIYFYNEIYD